MSLPWGVEEQRDSYFGQVSAAVAPVFEPAGFGTWEATGALATGFIAKEVVVSTMGQIYVGGDDAEGADAPAPDGRRGRARDRHRLHRRGRWRGPSDAQPGRPA